MAKDIGDGLRYAVDWDRDAFNVVCLGAVAEKLVGEADDTQRRIVDLRLPVLRADRDPHPSRHLVSDAVEGGSEEHTSELQSLMRISYAVFCLKKKHKKLTHKKHTKTTC